jgi:hypothetical protein
MDSFSLWIETEAWEGWNPQDANSDVVVTLSDGTRWAATFFTYANITTLTTRYKETGECLSGRYFWAADMILVDELNRQRIGEVVQALLNDRSFYRVFRRCTPAGGA